MWWRLLSGREGKIEDLKPLTPVQLLDAALWREIASEEAQAAAAILEALSTLVGRWLLLRSEAPEMDAVAVLCKIAGIHFPKQSLGRTPSGRPARRHLIGGQMKALPFLSLLTGKQPQMVVYVEARAGSWPLDLPLVQFQNSRQTCGRSATLSKGFLSWVKTAQAKLLEAANSSHANILQAGFGGLGALF